jgi:crossover junction endodeoxyribonuclease RuvC
MIILGIDPGSLKAGYAVIKVDGRKLTYVDSGLMTFKQEIDFVDRLGDIQDAAKVLITKYNPDQIAFESLIYVKSVTSLAKLAQARGAMIGHFASTHREKIFEYSPNLVKSTVSGHGHATKESVESALRLVFGERKYKSHDESDALAIALTHALLGKNGKMEKIPAPKKSRSLGESVAHKVKGLNI